MSSSPNSSPVLSTAKPTKPAAVAEAGPAEEPLEPLFGSAGSHSPAGRVLL
jgi:hypothetical protein